MKDEYKILVLTAVISLPTSIAINIGANLMGWSTTFYHGFFIGMASTWLTYGVLYFKKKRKDKQ